MFFFTTSEGEIVSREFQYTVETLTGDLKLVEASADAQVILRRPEIEGWSLQLYWRGSVEECWLKAQQLGAYKEQRRPHFIPAIDYKGEGRWVEDLVISPTGEGEVVKPARPKPGRAAYQMKLVGDGEKPLNINLWIKS